MADLTQTPLFPEDHCQQRQHEFLEPLKAAASVWGAKLEKYGR